MQKWVQGLGHRQQEVLSRLSKESVREHQNIRLAGEGGPPAAQGSYAQNAGIQAQHDIANYVSGIPVVGQAAGFLGKVSGSGSQPGQQGGGSFVGSAASMSGPSGAGSSPASFMSNLAGMGQGQGHGHGHHGHGHGQGHEPGSFMGNVPGVGGMGGRMGKVGEAQAFLGQFGGRLITGGESSEDDEPGPYAMVLRGFN